MKHFKFDSKEKIGRDDDVKNVVGKAKNMKGNKTARQGNLSVKISNLAYLNSTLPLNLSTTVATEVLSVTFNSSEPHSG